MRTPYVRTLPDGKGVVVLGVVFPSATVAKRDLDAVLSDLTRAQPAARLRLIAARIELSRLVSS